MTPNVAEFERLKKALGITEAEGKHQCRAVSAALGGVTIVRKGPEDWIASDSSNQVLVCDRPGAMRRIGGQGDILSGAIGTFLAWSKMADRCAPQDVALAALGGCHLTRHSAFKSYQKQGRSMITSEILSEIGTAFTDIYPHQENQEQ